MTDGEYNTQYYQGIDDWYTQGSAENGLSSEQAKALCDGMKAKGVIVYTVGFALNNQQAIETLAYCASDPNKALLANNGAELQQAFREIAFQIAQLRLSK